MSDNIYDTPNQFDIPGGPQPFKADRPQIINFEKSPVKETEPRPLIINPGQSFARNRAANDAIKYYIDQSEEPLSDVSRIQTARLISEKMGLSIQYVFENYDRITEEISGISNNPQKFGEYVSNQFKAGQIMVKKAFLNTERLNNPDSGRIPFIEQELEDLDNSMPPADTSDKGWLTGMVGASGRMVPYMWAISKYMIPGAALTFLSKGLAGKETIAAGLALAASLTTAAGTAVSYEQSYELAEGIIFGDMMDLTDEDGNKINEEYARMITKWAAVPYAATEVLTNRLRLTGAGLISDALKKLGKKGTERMLQRATFKAIGELAINGTLKKGVRVLAGAGGAALTGLTEEVIEEVIQDIYIERTAVEMAKNFTNELEDTGFLPYTAEETKEATLETIKGTIQGAFLLQFGGMVRSGMDARNRATTRVTAEKETAQVLKEDEVLSFAETATDEEFDEMVRVMSREADVEEIRKPEISITSDAVSISSSEGLELGKVDFSLDEDGNVVVDKIDLQEGSDLDLADQMMDALREKFPSKTVIEAAIVKPTDTIQRALQDRDPIVRDYNQNIDVLQTEIATAEAAIEDLDNQIQTVEAELEKTENDEVRLELLDTVKGLKEDLKFTQLDIDSNITTLERVQREKAELLKEEDKPIHEMTEAEFRDRVSTPEAAEAEFISTPQGEKLRKAAEENAPSLKPDEVIGLAKFIELRANALNMSTAEYIKTTFQDEVVAQPEDSKKVLEGKRKAAISFARDGRAVLNFGPASDFSSVAHELAHVFRGELTGKELKVSYNWAKKEAKKTLTQELDDALFAQNQAKVDRIQQEIIDVETSGEWTPAMEEAFAEGYEKFIWEGQTEQKSMKDIFVKFAEFMKRVYNLIVNDRKLTPAIRKVYDNLLSAERIEKLKDGTAKPITPENTFFQSDKKYDSMPEKELNEAIETFGITYNIDEAGYVLPDGRMLDFSGRHDARGYTRKGDVYIADGRDYLQGRRRIEHLIIEFEGIVESIDQFLDMGAMRVDSAAKLAEIGSRPTSKQYERLEELSFGGEVLIDMADGSRKDYIISSADFSKIKGQIERFYAGGTISRATLYQDFSEEYVASVKDAVKKGLDVPIKVLQQFPDQDWAVKEIERRQTNADMLSDFDWLTEMAQRLDTYEAFKDEAVFGDEQVSDKWLKNFYEVARADLSTIDINEGNKRWIKKLTDEYISDVIAKMSTNIKKARDAGVPVTLLAQAERYKSTQTLNDSQILLIRKIFRNNPSVMRAFVGEFGGQIEELNKLQREKAFAKELGIEDEFKRPEPFARNRLKMIKELENVNLQGLVREGKLSIDQIDELLNKSEDVIKADDRQIKELKEEYRKTRRADVKAAVNKAVAKRNQHYKDRDAKRKLKQHVRDLGAYIKRPIPSTVAIEQRLMIEALRAPIDPNFRRKSTIEKRELQKAVFGAEAQKAGIQEEAIFGRKAAKALGVDKEFLESLNKKSLGEIEVEELELLKNRIKGLVEVGKAMAKAKKEVKKAEDLALAAEMSRTMTKGKPFPDKIPPAIKGTVIDQLTELALTTYRFPMIADMMDGGPWGFRSLEEIKGGDFQGPIYDFFVNEVDIITDTKFANIHIREELFKREMDRLGITEKDFIKTYEIDGIKINAESIMEVYGGYKNDKHRKALQDAHGITPEIKDHMMQAVDPKLLQLTDYIMADSGGENFERARDAYRELNPGKDLPKEDFWLAMVRTSVIGAKGVEIDLFDNRDFGRKGLEEGHFQARQEISKEFQTPLSLGVVSNWRSVMGQMEHYIAFAEFLSTAKSILKDPNFIASANVANLNHHLTELRKYVDRVANPSIYKSNRIWNRAVRHARRGTAIAYLSFNAVTMAKQLPSIVYYLGYAGPQDFMSGIYHTIANWNETRELMEFISPQMRERSVERFIEDLKDSGNSDFRKIVNKVGLAGMKGILIFDSIVVTAGWRAVYDKNKRNGRSVLEAGQAATRATLNTQPAASAKDIASIYAEDNMLSIFLQFTNQLNQQWNIITYNAPQAILHKRYWKAIGLYTGMMVSALAMWMITNRRLPKDEDDFWDVGKDQIANLIPVLGRMVNSYMDGYNINVPLLGPLVEGAVGGLKLGEKALNGEDITYESEEKILWDIAEGFGIAVGGIPIVAPKRVVDGIQNGQPIQTILLGGEIEDD